MIAVKLMGGLGNQMFQYALGRSLAIEHRTKLLLDISHFQNQPEGETPREYELDCFKLKAKLTPEPVPTEEQPKRFIFKPKHFNIFTEPELSFKQEVLSLPDQTLLIGYWQSEKYFKKHEKHIRQDFEFKKPLSPAKQKILREIQDCPTAVSFQIRRGDYVTNPNSAKFHGLTSMTYYNAAVNDIKKRVKNPVFYVISDDPEWCEANIRLDFPTVFVDHTSAGWEDMYLMSQCKHNIIANSSFGWWAAWLNSNPGKIIYAPKAWFKEADARLDERLPKGWIKL